MQYSYTKLIDGHIKDLALPQVAFIPYMHQEWVRKEIEDLEEAGIIQRKVFLHMLLQLFWCLESMHHVHLCKKQKRLKKYPCS